VTAQIRVTTLLVLGFLYCKVEIGYCSSRSWFR